MSANSFDELKFHVGHRIEVARYENPVTGETVNVAIECMDCYTVLLDFDKNEDEPIILRVERCGDVTFACDFWDCNCNENYIHRKSDAQVCPTCGIFFEEQPDSRLSEIFFFYPDILTKEEYEEAERLRPLFEYPFDENTPGDEPKERHE
jgi:hypothetical protein